jgi:hypothetical protein
MRQNIELPARSKRNTYVIESSVTKPHLKGAFQVSTFHFDDIMLATFRKGASIEDYFRAFSRVSGPDLILIKEDFGRALASLSIDWASNINKVSEFFDVLDFQTHNGTLAKSLTP